MKIDDAQDNKDWPWSDGGWTGGHPAGRNLPTERAALARVHDPDGITNVVLQYRSDPQTNLTTLTMTDDGTLGDAVAGDGVRSATLPGFVAGTLIAFHIEVSNTEGADTTELQGKHDCRARLRAQLHAAPGAGPWTVRSHKHGLLLGEGKNMRLKNHPYLLGLILTFSVRLACGQAGPDILWKTNAHDTRISSIAISPNALLVASSDVDGFVRVWGAAGRALLKTFSLYMEEVYSVAFSPDGNYLGAGGGGGFDRYDSKVRVWSTGDWGLVTSLGDGARGVSAIAFSKDSAILAWTAASGNRLALWQISEGTYLVLLR